MKTLKFDMWLALSILLLVGVGTAIIYSSSGPYADMRGLATSTYMTAHLKKVIIGFVALMVGLSIPPLAWLRLARPMYILSVFLLIFLLIGGSGQTLNGAKRWISLGGFAFQPSELAKFSMIFLLAFKLSINKENLSDYKVGLIAPLALVGILFSLILIQPNYSTASTILIVALIMMYAAGTQIKHFIYCFVVGIPIVGVLAISSPYRMKRILAFFDPSANVNSSYQQLQSLMSLGNGGIFGTGLGEGTQKLGYLPMPFTDTIFAMVGEEMGFIGTLSVILLFGLLAYRGIKIAREQESTFLSLVALGITLSLAVNAFVHIGVCTKLLPPTGQPLPLISYGGTNLIMNLFALGVLLAISQYRTQPKNHNWNGGRSS